MVGATILVLAPTEFTGTAILVLQVLTLVVQLAMTVTVVIFRDSRDAGSPAKGETLGPGEPVKELWRRSVDKKRRVPRSSISGIPSWLLRYSLAPLSVAVALIISLLVRRAFHISHPLAWYIAAVVISVWYGGLGPGLISVTLSVLAIDYFILPRSHSLATTPSNLPYIVLFVLWGLVSCWFSVRRRGAEKPLKQIGEEWKRRWQGAAELIETNTRLQQEVTELRERIGKLEVAGLERARHE